MVVEAEKPLVMIVDDDSAMLNALKILLQRKYRVATCLDPVQSVEDIRRLQPSVLVLDVKMPAQNGFWVMGQVRKFDQAVPIILNSGYQDSLPADASAAYKPFAYLKKSGNSKELLQTIHAALESRGRA